MNNIKFNSKEHEMFYGEMLERVKRDDVYYKAFFYCMGACETTRKHIDDLFDFREGCIIPENIHQPYQTGTSYQVTRMAYNLWNGYVEEGAESSTTPSSLFACEFASDFHEALKIRYPEYFREDVKQKNSVRNSLKDLKKKEQVKSIDANRHDYYER
jgi:hypothetical protein